MTRIGTLSIVISGILLSGCKVDRYLEVVGANKADGTVVMQYEHGSEQYVLHWDEAVRDATQRCEAWGYSGAEFLESSTIRCIDAFAYGCIRWRVTYTAHCTDEHAKEWR